jgi:integrase
MSEKRITVWIQRFKDRPHLMLQWIDPDTGKRKSKSAETADERKAEAKRTDLEADLNNGRYQEASRMTWDRFRELFEAEYVTGRRPATRNGFRYALDLFERLANPARLRSITQRTISSYVAALRTMPVRGKRGRLGMLPSSIKVRLQFLHTALSWAVEQKMLPEVPAFPSVKVPRKKPQPVPAESFERLLAKAPDDQMRCFLLCGWLAGLRLGEAFALEWERTDAAPWIDLAGDRIVLPAEFAKAVEDQWVPLDPELREALLALPRRGRKVFCFTGPGGRPVAENTMSGRVSELAVRAGVKLTMHTLRKGFGCRYAGRVPAQVLQKLMRHGNIKTTMEFYANVDDAVREAVLGPKRNSPRNTQAADDAGAADTSHVNPSPNEGNGESAY